MRIYVRVFTQKKNRKNVITLRECT